MRYLLPFLLFVTTFSAQADEWTQADTSRQTVYTVLHVIDWRQTIDIARHPEQQEMNPVLGAHPNNSRINTYFATTLAAHYLIAKAFPAEYRKAFQYVTIGVEASVVQSNFALGLSVGF